MVLVNLLLSLTHFCDVTVGPVLMRALPLPSPVIFVILQFGAPSSYLLLRSKWPYTEGETGPTQKSRENGKENGKWPQARNGRKMAAKMRKWSPKWDFGGHFSAISGLGPFSIFFPIFPGFLRRAGFPFCIWPLRSQAYFQSVSPADLC